MAAKTPVERLDRLEQVMQVIAEDQLSLQKLIADLAKETRRGFDQVAARAKVTDERIDKLAIAIGETDRRGRQTDERIDKLVIAIGELIRHQSAK